MLFKTFGIGAMLALTAHGSRSQQPLLQTQPKHRQSGPNQKFNLEPDAAYPFAGITTFFQTPSRNCLGETGEVDDILIVGFPFDTATSYRTGARLGPNAMRQGSRAVRVAGTFNYRQNIDPLNQSISVIDCGDFPISPFDNALAFAQMEEWYSRIISRNVRSSSRGGVLSEIVRETLQSRQDHDSRALRLTCTDRTRIITISQTGRKHPQIIALGGDHSISLPILRALHKIHGPLSAIHIDAHIDTWSPNVYAGSKGTPSEQSRFADGTPYYWAGMEGLLADSSVHAAIRSTLNSAADIDIDAQMGFTIIPAVAIVKQNGLQNVIETIKKVVPRDKPVYLSLDIDALDPAFAPGTAGPASGGWTPRELIQIIIEALPGLNIVAADVVEVVPSFDHAEITAVTAAEMTFEVRTVICS